MRLPKRTDSQLVFKTTNKLSIYQINQLQIASFVFSSIHDYLPNILNSFYRSVNTIHSHSLRSKNNLYQPFAKKQIRKFSLRCRGPLIWNNIPEEIKITPSLYTFKKSFKLMLIESELVIGNSEL